MTAKTLLQIQQEGLDVLAGKLGPDDAIRFLQVYETGNGDWTKDRIKLSGTLWREGRMFLLRAARP